MSAFTLTFGNRAENHIGNEKLGGDEAIEGLTLSELERVKEQLGSRAEIIDLTKLLSEDERKQVEPAYLLVVRGGVGALIGEENKLLEELKERDADSKYWDTRRSKVLNKIARHNYCISDFERTEPDYEHGRGHVYDFKNMEWANKLRGQIGRVFGPKCERLQGEINLYYDVNKCGIGWHGDAEREIVVGARFGASFPLAFRWFCQGEVKGEKLVLELNDGDVYAMSAKAVGKDWKKRKIYTLRHAAGCNKYVNAK